MKNWKTFVFFLRRTVILAVSIKKNCASLALAALAVLRLSTLAATEAPYGLESRPDSKPYLEMPPVGTDSIPALLSQTGAFSDIRRMVPSTGLIPYELNVAFWSDGAAKQRWVSLPKAKGSAGEKIEFEETGEWTFPNGTVFVKHFELATNEAHPEFRRRLETRFIVRDPIGGLYGVTYKWRPDNSDAELLSSNLSEDILIQTASGSVRTQTWYYPSRQDCLTCHTRNAGGVLGVKTRQLNCDLRYGSGVIDNQIRAWNHIGLFDRKVPEPNIPKLPALSHPDDKTRTLEDRARSYLDANCAHCHRPGGTVASFDLRYDTPLPQQALIEAPVLIDEGIDHARAIAPNDIWRSIIYLRANALDSIKMPPLARNQVDERGMALLKQWIQSLPGPPVLEPPVISPRGARYDKPIDVTIKHSDGGAAIHYTLDGSVPTSSDPVYEKPLRLSDPAVLRAKAFKHGFTKSITAQEVFIVSGGH